VDGMLAATYGTADHFCSACFTGTYPVPLSEDENRSLLDFSDKEWARAELERVIKSLD
jgi:glutamine phosphoribosylpyrophosphate amidotransferase